MMDKENDLEFLVRRSVAGDKDALEELITEIQDPIFSLASRMLWHPEDARDATQEILLRITTHLGSFRGESRFSTWSYRIASNYLLTTRKRRLEREAASFDEFATDLEQGLASHSPNELSLVEEAVLIEEIKVGCSRAMLLCLDRKERLVYILGEILQCGHRKAAEILETSPAAFRKALERVRKKVESFTRAHCGLIDPGNACHCSKRIRPAIDLGRVRPGHLLFASPLAGEEAARKLIENLENIRQVGDLWRSSPPPAAPTAIRSEILKLLGEA